MLASRLCNKGVPGPRPSLDGQQNRVTGTSRRRDHNGLVAGLYADWNLDVDLIEADESRRQPAEADCCWKASDADSRCNNRQSRVGLLMFSRSIAFSLIELLLDRVAVVTVITPVREKHQVKSGGDYAHEAKFDYG